MFYVYIITNLINGKKYIGMSINKKPNYRETYYGSGKLIKQAIEKYGKENFTKEIIKEFDTEHDTREYERQFITEVNAVDDPMYYNLAPGGYGGGVKGRIMTDSQKEKLRNSLIGKKRSKEVCEKIASKLRGKKQTPENIERRKNAIKKHYENLTDEDKLKMKVQYQKIAIINTGKIHTDETKTKLSKLNATLTKEQVIEIIRIVENKELTYKQIALTYGINQSCICDIVKKRSYKWVWTEN